MRRFFLFLLCLAVLAGGVGWWISRPQPPAPDRLAAIAAHAADAEAGRLVFHAAGCNSCHAAPDATGEDALVLSGGHRLESEFGVFTVPNISPDPAHGIGAWTVEAFATSLLAGLSPEGRHYYPAFPYPSYTRMTDADIADLWAYMQTLPASDRPNAPNELAFPYNLRRGVGLWKWLYLEDAWVAAAPSETLQRGRYLVEALGHCTECHTPRDGMGGLDLTRWMGGAPNPSGRGRIPNITPAVLNWTADDIAYYLETGFTPDYDSAGGTMAAVVKNTAELPAEDREAIAAYVKGLAPVDPEG